MGEWIDGVPDRDGEVRWLRWGSKVKRGAWGRDAWRGHRDGVSWCNKADPDAWAPYTTGQTVPPVEVVPELPAHPMQPLVIERGVVRFRENKIVRFMLDSGPFGLNEISAADWPDGDYTHLMQLIGYSVSGYGELSTSPAHIVRAADDAARVMVALGRTAHVFDAGRDPADEARDQLRAIIDEADRGDHVEVVPALPEDMVWTRGANGWAAVDDETGYFIGADGITHGGVHVSWRMVDAARRAVIQRNGFDGDDPTTPPPQSTADDTPTVGDGGEAERFVPTEEGWYVASWRTEVAVVKVSASEDDDGYLDGPLAAVPHDGVDSYAVDHPRWMWLAGPLDLDAIVKTQAADVDPIAAVEAEGCTWDKDWDGPVLLDPDGDELVFLWPGGGGNCGHGDVYREQWATDMQMRAFLAKLEQHEGGGA